MLDVNENELKQSENNASLKLSVDSKAEKLFTSIDNVNANDLFSKREATKLIDSLGTEALNTAENRSKNLSSTISKMVTSNTENELDKNLEKLEKEIRSLDPSMVDFSKVTKGLGKLFSPITQYFNRLENEDEKIEDLISSLNVGRSILSNDNITLELEIEKISETIKLLNAEYEIGSKIKEKLEKKIKDKSLDTDSSQEVRFYEDEVIIPLEKKLYDIKQVIIVNEQSMMAMEIIRKNNKELIRNVDRIKNITLVAVNTAVMVAKSLYNQKVILKKINALESTTNTMILETGKDLNDESISIAKEIKKAEISIDGMKTSFQNAFNMFDEVKEENQKNKNEIEMVIDKIGGTV